MKKVWNKMFVLAAMALMMAVPAGPAFASAPEAAAIESVTEIAASETETAAATTELATAAGDEIETGSCGDQVTYQLNKTTGVLTISGTGDMNTRGSDGELLFRGNTAIRQLVIEEGVTSISLFAFRSCTSLTSVTIPESLTKIENGAFYLCDNLTEVHISSLESWMNIEMGHHPFGSSKGGHLFLNEQELTDLVIPEGVTKVDHFIYCKYLTSVRIPEGVTEIAQSAFAFCEGLTSVSIPDSVTQIGSGAFDACTSLTSISIPDGVDRIDFFYGCKSLKTVKIPASVTRIGYQAFAECTSLTTMVIPEGVLSIGEEAFSGCNHLSEVWLPGSLERIEQGAFLVDQPVHVCYAGNQTRWDAVSIEENNNLAAPVSFVKRIFHDVADSSKYYFRPVFWASEQGITNGYSSGYFGVDEDCTREQLITFLWRQAGKPAGKGKKLPFSDVDPGAYYYKAVLWAYEKGITKGYSTGPYRGMFGVGLPVTREDTVTFLYRMAWKPAVSEKDLAAYRFPDEEAGAYYCKPIAWAAKNRIAKGYGSGDYAGLFGVGLPVLRQDVVTFLYRFENQ